MGAYRSKPQLVEAVQWTGRNWDEVSDFWPEGTRHLGLYPRLELLAGKDGAQEWVPVPVGHWIVRQPGDVFDHWPVDPDYFAAKYEPAASA